MTKFPGWRTMTAAQRYNARKDAIFDDARRRGAFGGRSDLPGQLDMPGTEQQTSDLTQRRATAPLRPTKAQQPCDHGLFGDTANQVDLEDLL